MAVLHCIWPFGQFLTVISSIVVIKLIHHHAKHFRVPACQRKVIGILWMVPIFALHALLIFQSYEVQLMSDLIRDCYEGFVIYMFFSLTICIICESESGKLDGNYLITLLKEIDKDTKWLLSLKRGILQYPVLRVLGTIVGIVCSFCGYEEGGMDPNSPFLYIQAIFFVSCTLALYYLAAWYLNVKHDEQFVPHRIKLMFLGIKFIIACSFWQGVFLSIVDSYWLSGRETIPASLAQILHIDPETKLTEQTRRQMVSWMMHGITFYLMPIYAFFFYRGYFVEVYMADFPPRYKALKSRQASFVSTGSTRCTQDASELQPISQGGSSDNASVVSEETTPSPDTGSRPERNPLLVKKHSALVRHGSRDTMQMSPSSANLAMTLIDGNNVTLESAKTVQFMPKIDEDNRSGNTTERQLESKDEERELNMRSQPNIVYQDDGSMGSGPKISTTSKTTAPRATKGLRFGEYFGLRDTFYDVKLLFREPRTMKSLFNVPADSPRTPATGAEPQELMRGLDLLKDLDEEGISDLNGLFGSDREEDFAVPLSATLVPTIAVVDVPKEPVSAFVDATRRSLPEADNNMNIADHNASSSKNFCGSVQMVDQKAPN